MVFGDMNEVKEANVLSLEQLLMKRLEKAFDALDDGQGELFDDIVEEMEMLLKLKPHIYSQLLAYKQELTKNLSVLAQQAANIAASARNEIQRRNFYEGEIEAIEWDARKDYLDQIITIMGVNQMLPMDTSAPATLESMHQQTLEEEEPEEPETEKPPMDKKKKPKLSIETKKEFDV